MIAKRGRSYASAVNEMSVAETARSLATFAGSISLLRDCGGGTRHGTKGAIPRFPSGVANGRCMVPYLGGLLDHELRDCAYAGLRDALSTR